MSKAESVLNEDFKVLDGPQLLHKLIKWQWDTPALDFLGVDGNRQEYTYQDLRRCVRSTWQKIVDFLNFNSYGQRQIVPVLLPQCPGLYVSILALLEAGTAFCPINLDAPPDRIKFIFGDVSAQLVITTKQYEKFVTWEGGPRLLFIDEYPSIPLTGIDLDPPIYRESLPHDLAYVIYTSGSSGVPKGVAVSHLAVSQSLLAHEAFIPRFKRFLQFAAPSFDVSIFEIFFPLIRGSTLVGCNRAQMLNDLPGIINRMEVDAAELTPTVASSLVQNRSNVPGLKILLTIGEILTKPVVDSFGYADSEDGILYAMYGPTEAAIHCTINPRMRISDKVTNIGVPFANVSTFIAAITKSSDDGEARLLPMGETGELVLGGTQLAAEYINRDEQNKAAFITVRGQRAYRTGDKARITTSGTIEILGRISSGQVKLRGQRVELGEIEEVIYKCPEIKSAVASVIDGSLVAFILTSVRGITEEKIIEACSSWLPKFMIPSEILISETFPYLASGKVDKKALEEGFKTKIEDEYKVKYTLSTATERVIGNAIEKLCHVKVSATARLASAGVDSLMSVRLATLLRSLGFQVSSTEVLEADTVQSLALKCDQVASLQSSMVLKTTENAELSSAVIIDLSKLPQQLNTPEIDFAMICTPLQDAMLSETAKDEAAYRNKIIVDLPKTSDINRCQTALQILAEKNPILRTTFIELANQKSTYSQVIWKSLLLSQVEVVQRFSQNSEHQQSFQLIFPLHIQICLFQGRIKMQFQIHHAIYDAWSFELVLDDLNLILSDADIKPRPSFASVVEAQYRENDSELAWLSKDYWKDHLSKLNLTSLPNFHSVKNIGSGLAVTILKSSISTAVLEIASRRVSVSSQTFFQAAYSLVLSTYFGSEDICFGTVFSGRMCSIPGIEDIVGPCLATLPIRVDLATVFCMSDLIKEIHKINRKHLQHCSLPLRDIKRSCGVEPGCKVFDSILVWQQTLHEFEQERDFVTLEDSIDYLEFNLTIEITPSPGNIIMKANYQKSLFPARQIDMLLRQIEQLVLILMEHPSIEPRLTYSMFSQDLLSIENVNYHAELGAESLTKSVEVMAINYPDKIALEFAHGVEVNKLKIQRLKYRELNEMSNQIAHYLIMQAVRSNELICICMEKSIEFYVSILATTKAGAGYLPITPDTPLERIHQILHDAKVKVILAHSLSRERLREISSHFIIFVDKLDFTTLSLENPRLPFSQNNLAYCIFTSGSTGTPKGVLITQGNLLSNLQILAEIYPLYPNSKFLQACSQAFDVSVFEIFFAWYVGGCLCSAANDILFRDIEFVIEEFEITHLSLTPTVASLLDPMKIPKVKFLVTAGEAVTEKVFNAWADRGLFQGYGPCETTNICTVTSHVTKHHLINNIGHPLRNTSAFVLSPGDEFLLVPQGGEGEFCFGGMQVGQGYLISSQGSGKFIEHPKYGRLYRSGDYGRLLSDGSLFFTRRKDDQVKIRGQRVELGEIDSVVLKASDVVNCTTVVVDGKLVSFWIPRGCETLGFMALNPNSVIIRKLFTSLIITLPAYMIPSALVPVSRFPSTTQGKIDKRKLITHYRALSMTYLDQTLHRPERSLRTTLNEQEIGIANILADFTNISVADINQDTSFFSLGIDSLSAISLSRALQEKIGIRINISDILKYHTITRLTSRISQLDPSLADVPFTFPSFGFSPDFTAATIEKFEREGKLVKWVMPCTPLQEAMLSSSEISEGLYTQNLSFNLNSIVGIEDFQKVWSLMIDRHEIFRTCFVHTRHARFAYAQVVLKDYSRDWIVNNLCKDDSTESGLNEYKINETGCIPPYKMIFRRGNPSVIKLSLHHALYDGFAIAVLFDEIEKALKGALLPPAISFAPFINYMHSINFAEADAYWNRLMSGFQPFYIPKKAVHAPISNIKCDRGGWQRTYLKATLSWIENQIKELDCTFLSVCQTVWASLLSEYVVETDICFGNVVSGRNVPVEDVEKLVAPCFNTIPVRLKDLHQLSFIESFRILEAQNIDGLPFQLTPLRRIQSRSKTMGKPLFDTLLILQPPERNFDQSLWTLTRDDGVMDLPLILEITPAPARARDLLDVKLHYQANYLSSQDADILLKRFDSILTKALENPRNKVLSHNLRENLSNRDAKLHMLEVTVKDDVIGDVVTMSNAEFEVRDILSEFTTVPKEAIKRNTSIYRLGLDSVSAMQLAARFRKDGYNIMGSDVIRNPSIAELASHLSKIPETEKLKPKIFSCSSFDKKYRPLICSKYHLRTEDIAIIRPCTPIQCGMLALSLHSDGEDYINSIYMKMEIDTSLERIRDAWEFVRTKHEMLRTGFLSVEDSQTPFVMITYKERNTNLAWKDYRSHGSEILTEKNASGATFDDYTDPPWILEVFEDGQATMLKFTAHHALYDARSLEIILSDVRNHYASNIKFIQADQPSIDALVEAIIDASEDDVEARKSFWERNGKISIVRFPDLTPLRSSSTRSLSQEMTSKLSLADLERLCRATDISILTAGQSAWGRLLSFYVAEPLVSFGTTLSGRSVLSGSESVAFPTIVTLPISCNLVGTNKDLLNRTMKSNAQLLEHQFTPLTSIQRWAGQSDEKIFDTLFTYQKTITQHNPANVPWKIVQEKAAADYTVSMEIESTSTGCLKFRLTFKENVLPVEQARFILEQFDALLLDTLEYPSRPCDSLDFIGSSLLSITPAAEPELPSSVKLLHEFVELQARLNPTRTALEFIANVSRDSQVQSSWTFDELNQEGNKIANLLTKGVTKADLIAICFEKCPEASFAILGILKAGYTYVALDPAAPPDRVMFIMDDCRSDLILTAGKPFQLLSQIFGKNNMYQKVKVIDLSSEKGVLDGQSISTPILSRPISPQDTCYCLYTSGTTGTPKGCEITHENAVQAMMSFQKLFEGRWTKKSKWLQFASFHFDVSVLEQFWTWSVGICVVSMPRDLIFEDITGAIRQMGITHIDLTPSLARLLHPDDVPSLINGVFITGGEQLRQDILDVWGDYECIYNGYGPTEATIGVTMYPRVPKNGKPSNIGPQFQNVGSYVFKLGTYQPVLKGAIGELCVSGKLIGKGYLNRPDLTKERFPYIERFGERVYRTGDLVRQLYDGSFLFLGRTDDQVKLRGQRLEPSEINEVIKKYVKDVEDVITLVLKHKEQQKEQLVTFFVRGLLDANRATGSGLINSMRDVCRNHLASYMIPTYFIELDKLPLSANNKVDFKKLTSLFDDMTLSELRKLSSTKSQSLILTKKEQEVLKTIAHILKLEPNVITGNMNIFELGVDSISIFGLIRSLQSAGYVNARLSVVMKNSSIGSLIKILATQDHNNGTSDKSLLAASQNIAAFVHKNKISIADEMEIDPLQIEHLSPCTPTQEGMIYRFLGSNSALYFTTFNFALDDSIRIDFLREAWTRAARRLQILRTKFVLTNDGVAQVVLRHSIPIWKEEIIQGETKNLEEKLQGLMEEISKMGKLAALASPYRISIFRSTEKKIMSLNIFHGLYDGLSLPMLLRQVYEEYIGICQASAREIDYRPDFHSVLPYGPLALPENAESFWQEALKDAVYRAWPTLNNSKASKVVSISKTILDTGYLEDLRQQLGVTYQSLIQAAWCSALQGYISPNITTGMVLSGRSIDFPEVELIIGPMMNTVPFHVRIVAEMTWKDLIHACHSFNMQLLPYQHNALKDIQKWCGRGPNEPLFDTLFVFQKESNDDAVMEFIWKLLPMNSLADYTVSFEAQLNKDGDISITIVGQNDFLDEAAALSLLGKIERALHSLRFTEERVPRSEMLRQEEKKLNEHDEMHKQTTQVPYSIYENAFIWTSEAQLLKAEIEDLSGVGDVSEEVSIFELGLDSIEVIKLVSRLRKRGVHISVSAVINSQTIAKMLPYISLESPRPSSGTNIIQEFEQKLVNHLKTSGNWPVEAITAIPATPLQEAMVAEMIAANYTRYFNHDIFHVSSHVNWDKLKNAWDTVIKENDILRTRFTEIDDTDLPMSFAQVVYEPSESYWTSKVVYDIVDLDIQLNEIICEVIELAQNGPLLYLTDIRYGEEQYFILSIAHALYDGWSLQALHEDIRHAYNGTLDLRPDPRPTLDNLFNTAPQKAESFWKTNLSGLKKCRFPAIENDSKNILENVHRRELLSRQALEDIQQFCKSRKISLQILGQTTWALFLATYLNRLDVVFGAVLSCRDSERASQLMFPLMNTVALRSIIHGTVEEMLRYMQDCGNAIREYQHFPLRKAQALAGVDDGSLFDSLFIYQGRTKTIISNEVKLYESVKSVSAVEFAVCVDMEIVENALLWRTACKNSVVSAEETDKLLNSLDDILEIIIQNPGRPTISFFSNDISTCGLLRYTGRYSNENENERSTKKVANSSSTSWTAQETTIRRVLSKVSKIPERQIDRDQRIFHLGLDSITAIKVSSLLRREGIRLSVGDLTKYTIERMEEVAISNSASSHEVLKNVKQILANSIKNVNKEKLIRNAGTDSTNVDSILPVTAGQLYMLSRWRSSGGELFVGTFKYKLIKSVNRQRLNNAWHLLLKKHQILRTVFVMVSDKDPDGNKIRSGGVQIVLKQTDNKINWINPSDEKCAISLISPLSLSVLRKTGESLLFLRIHHALYDAISLPHLFHDLQELYMTLQDDFIPDTRFRKFVALSFCHDSAQSGQRQFWRSYLGNAVPTLLYADKGKGKPSESFRVEVFEPDIPINNVVSIARKTGVSVDALLLTAFSKVFRRLLICKSEFEVARRLEPFEDVIFGLYLANRAVYGEDLSDLAAPTLNLLPIRVALASSIVDIALHIQADLQRLGNVDIAGSSLADVFSWTRMNVNCFVNILKSSADSTLVDRDSNQLFKSTGEDLRRKRADVVKLQSLQDGAEVEIGVRDEVYLPSIDVEMRVTEGGVGLDLGVFAPMKYFDTDGAQAIVEGMKEELNSIG